MTKGFDFEVVFSEVARFTKYRLLDPEFLFLVIGKPSSIGQGLNYDHSGTEYNLVTEQKEEDPCELIQKLAYTCTYMYLHTQTHSFLKSITYKEHTFSINNCKNQFPL